MLRLNVFWGFFSFLDFICLFVVLLLYIFGFLKFFLCGFFGFFLGGAFLLFVLVVGFYFWGYLVCCLGFLWAFLFVFGWLVYFGSFFCFVLFFTWLLDSPTDQLALYLMYKVKYVLKQYDLGINVRHKD